MKPDDKRFWEKLNDSDDRWRKKKKRKEDFQTINAVIDQNASKVLSSLQSKGILKEITGTIASGKESGVFLANLGPKGDILCQDMSITSPIVLKIFRTSTLNFKKILTYISGDIRFKKYSKKTRSVIKLWVEKEFKNLNRSTSVGVNAPKPILVKNNVLLMELIGENGIPSPLLKSVPQRASISTLETLLQQVSILYKKAGLVHGDLSPYNIIMKDVTPYVIDMSQSVLVSHPNAQEFLKRDLSNILTFFNKLNFPIPDLESVYEVIVSENSEDKNIKV
ncbi:MAG: serine protein kinase RIO [Candidatus Hodarchaeales archaeon]|jgi:RIO kinase 1